MARLLSSRKLKPDDFNAALVSILSFSDDLTPEIVEGRKKMFDALVEQKDSHGHKVISTGDIKDVLEINLSDMVEPTSLSQELVDHAQKYLKNPHTRLSEAQHPTPTRTKSSKPISKRRTGPERL